MCTGSRRDGSGWVKGCAKNMGFAVRQLWGVEWEVGLLFRH